MCPAASQSRSAAEFNDYATMMLSKAQEFSADTDLARGFQNLAHAMSELADSLLTAEHNDDRLLVFSLMFEGLRLIENTSAALKAGRNEFVAWATQRALIEIGGSENVVH